MRGSVPTPARTDNDHGAEPTLCSAIITPHRSLSGKGFLAVMALVGGLSFIGRTPLRIFDAARGPPAPMAPGDRVKFFPIDRSRFDELSRGEGA